MPARARRRAIQPGRRTANARGADDVGERDMAAYIRPPTTNTARLATGTPCHSTENNRQRTLTTSGMKSLPTLHCENETGHERALSVPWSVPRSSACDQPESEAFPKRARSVPRSVAKENAGVFRVTISAERHVSRG